MREQLGDLVWSDDDLSTNMISIFNADYFIILFNLALT
ncbi:hypothetical protein SynA1524_01936 [Synechococcus sp. A15-24]|nr:hypothetical protein SynA1524_01936 [Synechococcus sp. A15-24]